MALDVHAELAGIKARVPPAQRPAAYASLVRKLEAAKKQATHLHIRHRLSVLVHLVKARARQDHDWL
jgi:hypothetical protein